MKGAFLSLLIAGSLFSKWLSGQKYVDLSVDNDLYFGIDRYYSSGVFISFGKLKQDGDQRDSYPKKFVHWTLGQEIYTPKNRYTRNEYWFDYPYGGWLFLEHSFEKYKNPFSAWGISLKAGVTGKASLAPFFQNLYHNKVLGLRSLAWEQALPQRFHVNLNLMHRKRLQLNKQLAFLFELFGNLGTQRVAAGGRLGFLLGSSRVLTFMGNPLEMQTGGYGIYLGSRQEYRLHDYMISGSLFDNDAPFVLTNIPIKNSLEAGFAFYSKNWRLLTLLNSISKDNQLQVNSRHPYLKISIARFF